MPVYLIYPLPCCPVAHVDDGRCANNEVTWVEVCKSKNI